MRRMALNAGLLSIVFVMFAAVSPVAAASTAPGPGAAAGFAVLADGTGLTCTARVQPVVATPSCWLESSS
jgi:hypothetical protein